MDQQYIKEHQLVERFVLDQLSGQELDEFLVYQMMHPEIQTAIEEERERMKSVRAMPHNGISGSAAIGQWWWIGGTALIILLAAWFFFNKNNSDSLSPTNNENIETLEVEAPVQEKTPPTEEINEENIGDKPVIQDKNKSDQKKKTPPTTNRPIAQRNPADFAPLDYWETLSELSMIRDPSYNFSINSPSDNQIFESKSGKITINFKGILKASSLPENDIFKIWVYSNKKADLLAGNPVFEAPLNFTKNNDDFIFELNAGLNVKPGLYYFYIALVSIENPLVGGKFTVEN